MDLMVEIGLGAGDVNARNSGGGDADDSGSVAGQDDRWILTKGGPQYDHTTGARVQRCRVTNINCWKRVGNVASGFQRPTPLGQGR